MTLRSKPWARRRRMLPLRRGYSLAAVFLLIATIAVLASMARSVSMRNVPWEVLAPNLAMGILGGGLIGGTIGIQYQQRVRSTIIGIMGGSLTGLVAAAITIADFSPAAA